MKNEISLFPGFGIERDASFSDDGQYRWSLTRAWDKNLLKPWVGWIMLNPSTADGETDDPTIRRCMAFAMNWGFSGITVMNLFGFRATEPAELLKAEHPVCQPGHEAYYRQMLLSMCGTCPLIIAAWGVHGAHRGRGKEVIDLFRRRSVPLHCLGVTKDGHPKHPLYLPGSVRPLPFPAEVPSCN